MVLKFKCKEYVVEYLHVLRILKQIANSWLATFCYLLYHIGASKGRDAWRIAYCYGPQI
jgi:hypothetical protein